MISKCRVVLTDKCNLDCSFCCMKDLNIKHSFKSVSALEIAEQGYGEVAITGGEPLLELKKLVQFICLIKYFNPNTKVYLYTNGHLLQSETAATLKIAGLDGINWSPHEKPNPYCREQMTFIHACLIPIRILIQDILMDDDILKFAMNDGMQIKQWTIGDCDDMEPEDRFRIDWSIMG